MFFTFKKRFDLEPLKFYIQPYIKLFYYQKGFQVRLFWSYEALIILEELFSNSVCGKWVSVEYKLQIILIIFLFNN